MTDHLFSVTAVLAVVGAVQAGLLWRLVRLARGLRAYDDRFAHLSDALSLLTETTEASFRAVAQEVERLGASGTPRSAGRTSTRRVAAAARSGKTVQEIAAAERVSEGEVRLRLHLAEEPAVPRHEGPPHQSGADEPVAASA
jgi:hypothetical protein